MFLIGFMEVKIACITNFFLTDVKIERYVGHLPLMVMKLFLLQILEKSKTSLKIDSH